MSVGKGGAIGVGMSVGEGGAIGVGMSVGKGGAIGVGMSVGVDVVENVCGHLICDSSTS
jgi:hypothetical protein